MKLTQEDHGLIEAAEGWLELGNYLEANDELDKIAAEKLIHPDVLSVRWKVYASAKKWDGALAIAETLTDQLPGYEHGWLYLAATLHGMGKTEDAYETLVGVIEEFADHPAIPYQAACYACALGEVREAKQWLEMAIEAGDENLKLKALADPELKPLWDRIGET